MTYVLINENIAIITYENSNKMSFQMFIKKMMLQVNENILEYSS